MRNSFWYVLQAVLCLLVAVFAVLEKETGVAVMSLLFAIASYVFFVKEHKVATSHKN